MLLTLSFIGKWKWWYRVLRYREGLGRLDYVRYGLWLARSRRRGLILSRREAPNARSDLRAHFAGTNRGGSVLEIDAWIPSEINEISPLVERLMRLIEGSHCITGEENAVQMALREALNNAVVHGNRQDARKLVHVRCRLEVGNGIWLSVSDQGQGFDAGAIPDLVDVENPESEHGRGIQLMKSAMDEVSFEQGGIEVHMSKRLAQRTGG